MTSELLATARTWLQLDPTNAGILTEEIEAAELGDETALAALTARFAGHLTFGTAGLRAPLGPGTTRMNTVVVQRAAAGIADFALERVAEPTVVIGYDARHGSQSFALASAAVLTAAGCRVRLMSTMTPTPVLAFALKRMHADVGIMVTASHNPPTDNGYKVYLGTRLVEAHDAAGADAQITAPTDHIIAGYIQRWNATTELPSRATSGWEWISDSIIEEYVVAVADFLTELSPSDTGRAALKTVYTPLHGVGAETFSRLMESAGFASPYLVAQQQAPDPAFPTVAFPNPEEPGALDLAIDTAQSRPQTDLILAHDPDADRLAVAVPVNGQWQRLTGDQLGLLLGAHLMPYLAAHGLAVGNSVVSAPQLARLANRSAVHHQATPTGFKWICRVPNLGYGYEEALGYAVAPHLVNDKDGLSAAVIIADLAAQLKTEGRTLLQYLAELTNQLGPTLTEQVATIVPSPTVGQLLVDDLRSNPPDELAGISPVVVIDYQHEDVALSKQYGPMNMLEFSTDYPLAARLMIRPSGTEPKVKCYVSVSAAPGTPLPIVQSTLHRLRNEAATLIEVE